MRTVTLESGTYEVLEVIRKTQDKSVALARCARTGEKVILRTQRQDSEAYLLLTAIRDPHLARVLSVQRVDGGVCVVEEYVRGSLLSDVLDRGLISSAQAVSIGIQLCDALEALHSAGIVHRDVKPENIMLQPDGSVKLFDYDAARVYNVLAGRDTTLMGTVGYAAPEQFGLTQSDARSDIYSLGVLLNLLLTDAHPSVRLCRGALRPIVLRCTHVNPERRYQSVRSVRRRLTLMQNRGRLLTCAALAAVCLLLLTMTALYRHTPAPTPAPETVAALPMPMGFTDQTCSVQSYALDGVNYTLIISMDGQEMYAPDIKSNTRHFYLPEYETTPLFVCVIPEDGSAESIRRFKNAAASVTCSVQPQTGEAAPIAPRNFGDTLYDDTPMLASGMLCADAAAGMEPRHCMATARIAMKNGDAIDLGYSVTQIPSEVTLDAAQYPMNTSEQLNQLLSTLDMAYGWNADVPVTLRLPQTVYTEEIVLRGRSVNLQGAPGGTILTAGLRATAADDVPIALRDLTFRGDGSGSAITSARDVTAIDCAFTQYEAVWRAIDGAQFSSRGCTFEHIETPVPASAVAVPTTFR